MKIWQAYGSEHSMNLVMIGHFEDASAAAQAKLVIDTLTEKVSAEVQAGRLEVGELNERFSDEMLEALREVKVYLLGPTEMEQFAYDVHVELSGDKIELRTDESDVSAFLKVLIDQGARVEVFSAHHHSSETSRGE